MITNLKINNYTLIDSLDISFNDGFSVITGETGAGKSIILGALSMLLGQRADTKAVKQGAQKFVVEAHFDITGYNLEAFFEDNDIDYDESDCILRREVTAVGKSRCFINDLPVSLSVMKALGEQLVDIHSQHQNLLLRDSGFQLSVVDIISGNQKQLTDYKALYSEYRKAENALKQMKEQAESNNAQEDFMRFQYQELQDAKLLNAEEQEELEAKSKQMSHAEDIKSSLYNSSELLNGDNHSAVEALRTAANELQSIASVFPDAQELAERLDSSFIEVKDIASEVTSLLDAVDFDPQEMEQIDARLDVINSLERKYHCQTITELMAVRDDLAAKLELVDNSEEMIGEQEKMVSALKDKALASAKKLTAERTKAAKVVEKEMQKRLVPLGIPHVQFKVALATTELSSNGVDDVSFLFSANTSTPMQPVTNVASGGEIARVMLSLKAMISNAVKMPTIIFDEIDTGVSGKIAEAMALIMKEMGTAGRQVLSITHLPQIAARGANHYKVAKTETPYGTRTSMIQLTSDQRVEEIAQMLSGTVISSAALAQANELLSL